MSKRLVVLKSAHKKPKPILSLDSLEDKELKSVIDEEEEYSMVVSIREEIVENALQICDKKNMEKETIAFTVKCAKQAWLRMLSSVFLNYDSGVLAKELWMEDSPILPAVRDSWSEHSVIVVKPKILQPASEIVGNEVVSNISKESTKVDIKGPVPSQSRRRLPQLYGDQELLDEEMELETDPSEHTKESSDSSFFSSSVIRGTSSKKFAGSRCVLLAPLESIKISQGYDTKKYKLRSSSLLARLAPLRLKGTVKIEGKALKTAPSQIRPEYN